MSGYTTVAAASMRDAAGNALNGTIYFQPCTAPGGVPTSFRGGGDATGQRAFTAVSATITNGAFSIQLCDVSMTSPVDVGYIVTVEDALTGDQLLGPGYIIQPTGTSVWSFDAFIPDLVPNVTIQTGPVGPPAVFLGPWNSATPYTIAEAVSLQDGLGNTSSYVSLVNGNVGNNPATDSAAWALLASSGVNAALSIDSANALLYSTSGSTLVTIGDEPPLADLTGATSGPTTSIVTTPMPAGYLEAISCYYGVATPGTTVTIMLLSIVSGVITAINAQFNLTAAGVGPYTYNANVDYTPIQVQAGWQLAIYTPAAVQLSKNNTNLGLSEYVSAQAAVGSTLIGYAGTLAISGSVRVLAATVPVAEVPAVLAATIFQQNTARTVTIGVVPATQTSATSGPTTLVSYTPVESSGPVTSVSFALSSSPAGTTADILLLSGTPGTYALVSKVTVTSKGAGTQTYVAGVDYPVFAIAAGQFIGVYSTQPIAWMSSGGPGLYYLAGEVSASPTAFSLVGGAHVTIAISQQPYIPPIVQQQASGLISRGRTLLDAETFASVPNGWTTVGNAWSIASGGGLLSPANPNAYADVIYSPLQFASERRTYRVGVQLVTSGAVVGFGSYQPTAVTRDTLCGTLVVFDATNNLLKLSNTWQNTGNTGVDVSVALGFFPTTGVTYTLTVSVNQRILTASIIDPATGTTATVTTGSNTATDYWQSAGAGPGNMLDSPAFVGISGQFSVLTQHVYADINAARLAIYGDSITQGHNVTLAQRWASLVADQVGPTMVSGRSGGFALGVWDRLQSELSKVLPEYVLILIGTNDSAVNDAGDWVVNVSKAIAYAQGLGVKVLLGTVPYNNQSNAGALGTINGYILNRADVTVIRFDEVITSSNLGAMTSDGTHPNAAGSIAMAARVFLDAPFLADAWAVARNRNPWVEDSSNPGTFYKLEIIGGQLAIVSSTGIVTIAGDGSSSSSTSSTMTDSVTGSQYTLQIQNGNLIAVPVS